MRQRIVVDCSIVAAWLFRDERNEYAFEIARQYRACDYLVPSLWKWEIANTLLIGQRRKRCSQEDVTAWLAYLAGMPFQFDEYSLAAVWNDTLEFANDHQLTVYDAAYLELAHRESIPLATLDDEMKKAAKAAGVKLFRLEARK